MPSVVSKYIIWIGHNAFNSNNWCSLSYFLFSWLNLHYLLEDCAINTIGQLIFEDTKFCRFDNWTKKLQWYLFTPTIRKTLQSCRETHNDYGNFAVVITDSEDDTVIKCVPSTISVPCDLFLRRGGTISCTITGLPQYSRDLVQGRQKVPCKLVISGPVKDNFKQKVQYLLEKAPKLECFVGQLPPAVHNTHTTSSIEKLSVSTSSSLTRQTVHVYQF